MEKSSKDRMTIAEYRQMMDISIPPKASDLFDNAKMNGNEYTLLCGKNKVDSKENKRPSKYLNRKCEYQGIKFDSEGELKRWVELELLQRAGKIIGLQRQVRFTVFDADCYQNSIHWIPDFLYQINNPNGKMCVEDFKSEITAKKPDFRIKVKLFKKMYPEYLVYISTTKGVREWK